MSTTEPWRFKWRNFRGYEKSPVIEFPALTLIIGRNNAGKSTLYAPLLLLRQTLEARNSDTALLFRGELVDFGTYRDVVTDHDISRGLGMLLDFGEPRYKTRGLVTGDVPIPQQLDITFGSADGKRALLEKSVVLDNEGKRIVSRGRSEQSEKYIVHSTLLPKAADVGRPLKEVTELRQAMQNEQPRGFLFNGLSGLVLPSIWRKDKDRWQKVQGWYQAVSNIFDVYRTLNMQIEVALDGIAYIGPLRHPPRRSYLLSAEPPDDVGRDGQWASELLFQSRSSDAEVIEKTNYWLSRLGYGELKFVDMGEYFQVFVKKPDSNLEVNLADCGVGLSQLLPLLVQGCAMDEDETLIAQQPEIHLNPAQQDILTDFFVELACAGKRVIIETHSEHVLTRLRRRIAEGQSIESSQVALYFSESDVDRSTIRRINIGEWGEVSAEEWPKGFFGEQLDNSLKLALAQARRKKTSGLSADG